jgi:hypothetical protein
MHLRPFQGPVWIGPTLLALAIQSRKVLATGA